MWFRMSPLRCCSYLLAGLIAVAVAPHCTAADLPRAVAKIFEDHCLRCHKPGNTKGDVELGAWDALKEQQVIVPGEPEHSGLVEAITGSDGEPPRMPKEGAPLTKEQVEAVRQWIEDGAAWPADLALQERSKADASWWAFQPLGGALPSGLKTAPASPVDAFIEHKLEEHGLHLSPPADRATWLRRVKLNLTGLLPTPEEVDEFIADKRPDARQRRVDRYLASPAYGEQWGRHWLDVVRFGESNGYERNVIIDNLWPFRDYVIDGWNTDKPYDQLVIEHLAGDAAYPGDPAREIGTAFLVAGPYDDVGNQDPKQAAVIRANAIDEMIRTTSEAFLGLTVGCARCHDHKFDPVLQQDYYAMYATFAGTKHGSRVLASPEQLADRAAKLAPLAAKLTETRDAQQQLENNIVARAEARKAEIESAWKRPPVDRYGTSETFAPVEAKFVKLQVLNRQDSPDIWNGFRLDEFEVWSAEAPARNVALASEGGRASGGSRVAQDFQDAYGADLTIDGHFGERWIATAPELTIELAEPTRIERVFFSSDRTQALPQDSPITTFIGDYKLSVSSDGANWHVVADSEDRQPSSLAHRRARMMAAEITGVERERIAELRREIARIMRQIGQVPNYPSVWVGEMSPAPGPFKIFLGGDPSRTGSDVVIASPSAWAQSPDTYSLSAEATERDRRLALARWIVDERNPLPPRVMVNRIWQWHFGSGIVDTPSDFGYLGQPPEHPELLDWLAAELMRGQWGIKRLQRMLVLSDVYAQGSQWRADAAAVDAQARWLWRFPPRRMTAEEIRDAILSVSAALRLERGGPGFRLYRFLQDNVSTYVPLDSHGPETWRRSVYHQNVRAQLVDVISDFDCPDPAAATPKRATTTTPLQALTMLNHGFTLQMSEAWAQRLEREQPAIDLQITAAFEQAFARSPTPDELQEACALAKAHGLAALCRALLNSSELIYIN